MHDDPRHGDVPGVVLLRHDCRGAAVDRLPREDAAVGVQTSQGDEDVAARHRPRVVRNAGHGRTGGKIASTGANQSTLAEHAVQLGPVHCGPVSGARRGVRASTS